MKIQVIKKAVAKAKPSGYCSTFVDDFPISQKTR